MRITKSAGTCAVLLTTHNAGGRSEDPRVISSLLASHSRVPFNLRMRAWMIHWKTQLLVVLETGHRRVTLALTGSPDPEIVPVWMVVKWTAQPLQTLVASGPLLFHDEGICPVNEFT